MVTVPSGPESAATLGSMKSPPSPTRRKVGPIADHRDFIRPRTVRKRATVAHLAEEWLGYRDRLRLPNITQECAWRTTIAPAFAKTPVAALGPDDVEGWISALVASGFSPTSVRNRYGILRAMLEWGLEEGWIDSNPAAAIRRSVVPAKIHYGRSEAEVLTPPQIAKVVFATAVPLRRRALWAGLLLTGARFGEAAALAWADVELGVEPLGRLTIGRTWDCKRRELRQATKERQVKRVPIHPALVEVLARWQVEQEDQLRRPVEPSDPLFPKDVRSGERWSETSCLRAWRQDLLSLGITHPADGPRRLHATRHTFISQLHAAGGDSRNIAFMTHKETPRSAFSRYVHPGWPVLCRTVLLLQVEPLAEQPELIYEPTTAGLSRDEAREARKAGLLPRRTQPLQDRAKEIRAALQASHGNIKEAARQLGWPKVTLYDRVRALRLDGYAHRLKEQAPLLCALEAAGGDVDWAARGLKMPPRIIRESVRVFGLEDYVRTLQARSSAPTTMQ